MLKYIKQYYIHGFILMMSFILFIIYMIYIAGQPMFCKCTPLESFNGFTIAGSNSQMLIDWYTLSHLIYGALFLYVLKLFKVKLSIPIQILFITLFSMALEMIEHTEYVMFHFRSTTISTSYYGDTIINSLTDVLAAPLGFLLAHKIRVSLLLLLILTIELASFYFIHDNLTINILSFILPNEWMDAIFYN